MVKPTSVQDYFEKYLLATKDALIKLKKCILEVVPNATQLINYNIPSLTLLENGTREHQIMIVGYAKHVGLYPHPKTIEKFKGELQNYKTGKGCVQFSLDHPLSIKFIKEMIAYHLQLVK